MTCELSQQTLTTLFSASFTPTTIPAPQLPSFARADTTACASKYQYDFYHQFLEVDIRTSVLLSHPPACASREFLENCCFVTRSRDLHYCTLYHYTNFISKGVISGSLSAPGSRATSHRGKQSALPSASNTHATHTTHAQQHGVIV